LHDEAVPGKQEVRQFQEGNRGEKVKKVQEGDDVHGQRMKHPEPIGEHAVTENSIHPAPQERGAKRNAAYEHEKRNKCDISQQGKTLD